MQERHDILTKTIGYLDQEQEALDRGKLLVTCSTITIIIGSLFEMFFFYLYNGRFHPFALIVMPEQGKVY